MLTRDAVGEVLDGLSGTHSLLAKLLYGTGRRISEALQLRVKDLGFGQQAFKRALAAHWTYSYYIGGRGDVLGPEWH